MVSKSDYVADRNRIIAELDASRATIANAERWAREMLDRHQPYISGRIDVSISSPDKMHADMLQKLGSNIWCEECSTPFPCRQVSNLRALRGLLRGGDFAGLPTKQSPRHEGHIPTAL